MSVYEKGKIMSTAISTAVTDEDLNQRFAEVFARIADTAVAREQGRELALASSNASWRMTR